MRIKFTAAAMLQQSTFKFSEIFQLQNGIQEKVSDGFANLTLHLVNNLSLIFRKQYAPTAMTKQKVIVVAVTIISEW